MKKTEKRTYLHPETEVVRFTADIITTSGDNISGILPEGPGAGDDDPASSALLDYE